MTAPHPRATMTRYDMALKAGEVGDLLRTLANPNRLMIVCTLVEGERSVAELEHELGIHLAAGRCRAR